MVHDLMYGVWRKIISFLGRGPSLIRNIVRIQTHQDDTFSTMYFSDLLARWLVKARNPYKLLRHHADVIPQRRVTR
jgi:hypothetical protein